MSDTCNDRVNHPAHYNAGNIEVIDAIEDWRLGFNLGNAVKYIARAEHKGRLLEDLRKASWYLAREITRQERLPTVDPRMACVDRMLSQLGASYVEQLIRRHAFVGVQVDDEVYVMHADVDIDRDVFVPLAQWQGLLPRVGGTALIREADLPTVAFTGTPTSDDNIDNNDVVVATSKVNADGETEWSGENVQVPDDPGPSASFADRIAVFLTRQIIADWRNNTSRARQFHSTQIAEAIGVMPRTKRYNAMCSALTKLVRQRRIVRVRRGMYMGKFRPPRSSKGAADASAK